MSTASKVSAKANTAGQNNSSGGRFGASARTAPSLLLPLRFMLAGLAALFTAGVALVWRPEILATYHYNQHVIAVTHLLVLGWILTVVMGAMYQLVPVALETRLYSERLARWQFVCHCVGVAGMVWMFWIWNLTQVAHFGSLLSLGVGLFIYNLARTLLRVPRWNVSAGAIGAALGWLSLTVLAGLTILTAKTAAEIAELRAPAGVLSWLLQGLAAVGRWVGHFDQFAAMHAHAHLGAVGIFTLLIVGISYKLVPMFTLSEVQNPRRAHLSVILLNAGLLGAFITILLRSPFRIVYALVLMSALAIYGLEIRAIIRARKRRSLDWGMRYFLTAIGLLAPVSVLGFLLAWPGLPLTVFTGQLENLYGFLGLVGVISFAIIGMLYKILPFLVWYGSYSRRIGLAKVPSLGDLYSAKPQRVGYWTYLAGLGITSTGIVLGHLLTTRLGCALLVISLAALAANTATILSHLFNPRIEAIPAKAAPVATAQRPRTSTPPGAPTNAVPALPNHVSTS